jgi:DNA transposition AAA+ family ATPase
MRTVYAETENYTRLLAAVQAVEQRAAREAGLIVVTSEPGYGKTRAVQRFAVQHGAVYLRAMTHWTPHIALAALVRRLGAAPEFGRERLLRQAMALLSADGGLKAVILDEAEHLLRDTQVLETVRDLSDSLENVVVLVGMERLRTTLQRYPQVSSRVARAVTFQPASLEDVALLCRELAEVPIGADVVEELHRRCQGRPRVAINAIKRVEERARANRLKTVALADVRDVLAEDDWRRNGGAKK